MSEEVKETMEDFAADIERSMRKVSVGDIMTGTVLDVNEECITLDLGYYAQGIVKPEDYSADPHVTAMDEVKVGQELKGTVVSTDDGKGNILLSCKEANSVLAWDKLKKYLENGETVSVKVAEAVKGGVVTYLEGIRAFIPASKLSLSYVEDLETFVGQTLEVKVITAEEEGKKLVLSAKEILMDKRREDNAKLVSNMQVGLVTEGVVESIKDYGAFVRLSNGLSGLLHVSQISNQRVANPASVLKEGETVKVKITAIKDGKISLSKKALEEVAATEIREEVIELPEAEEIGTSLAGLLKGLKFD